MVKEKYFFEEPDKEGLERTIREYFEVNSGFKFISREEHVYRAGTEKEIYRAFVTYETGAKR